MSQQIEIRAAGSNDVESLAVLLGELLAQDSAAVPAVFLAATRDECVDHVRELLAGKSEFFVAVLAGEVVGMISLEEVHRPARVGWQAASYVNMHLIAVLESHRRRGIGTRLIEHARDVARKRGVGGVRLHVWEHNEAARKTYEALGFSTMSRVMGMNVDLVGLTQK